MAEPPLDRPGVVALIGERIAAGVTEHVRMRLQLEARGHGRPLDHPGKAGGRERRAVLADEDEGRRHALALETSQMSSRSRAFVAPHSSPRIEQTFMTPDWRDRGGPPQWIWPLRRHSDANSREHHCRIALKPMAHRDRSRLNEDPRSQIIDGDSKRFQWTHMN
jgi:hypothetical protein